MYNKNHSASRTAGSLSLFIPVTFFYPAQVGGPCNSLYWLSEELTRSEVKVTIVTTNLNIGNQYIPNVWHNTSFGRVKYVGAKGLLIFIKYFLAGLQSSRSADTVLLTSFFSPSSFMFAWVFLLQRKNIVWSPRGEFDEFVLKRRRRIKCIMIHLIKPFVANITFHTTSNIETAYLKRVFPKHEKIIQLPNYIQISERSPVTKENYFLIIGRIDRKKGIENAISACLNSTKFMRSDFKLKIVGDRNNAYGAELEDLVSKNKAEHKVEFIDHISIISVKNKIFSQAYFTLLPSHTENFGNVVVESLMHGTPVLASKGTPWEILSRSGAGFWVCNSVESIKATIDKIFELSLFEYQHMCSSARALSVDEFGIKKNIYKWIQVLQTNSCAK